MSTPYPRLCCGTFYNLLIRGIKDHGRSDATASNGFVGYSQRELLKGLLKTTHMGSYFRGDTTLDGEATRLKQCENIYPIQRCDHQTVEAFNADVRSGGESSLPFMESLVAHFFDSDADGNNINKKKRLVRSLLQLIRDDEEIDDDQVFYCGPGNITTTKTDFLSTINFYLPHFLLGIWHYCFIKVPDNTVGQKTYQDWYPNNSKGFASSIGLDHRTVNLFPREDNESSQEQEHETGAEDSADEPTEESIYYQPYFDAITRSIGKVNTILRAEAYNFYDFYLPTGLGEALLGFDPTNDFIDPYVLEKIEEPSLENLRQYALCIMIQATGGMGKSMLLRHLMFDGIMRCKTDGLIPIFISLKNYRSSNYEITEFLYDEISHSFPDISRERFQKDLSESKYILLLDGLDEISSAYRGQFISRLYSFLSIYRYLQTILSSRHFSDDIPTNEFRVLTLCPLTKQQAIALIKKIEYRPDIPNLKSDFIKQLKKGLYDSYHSFAINPLLLTFMLIKFCEDGKMTESKTDFYEEVFDVLATRHDSKKVGYQRILSSGLSHERLKDIFAAFCAKTYQNNELSFLKSQLITYFTDLIARLRTEEERKTSPEKLLEDFVSGVCMLYKDGERYYFVHRSFQEYFCARAFKKQKPEKLAEIGIFFETQRPGMNNMAFDFLYDMIPELIEEFILIPFLKNIFEQCDNQNGYWTYITRFYPDFSIEVIDLPSKGKAAAYTGPRSFILDYLIDKMNIGSSANIPDLFPYKEFVKQEYVTIKGDYGDELILSKDKAISYLESRDRIKELETNPPETRGYVINLPTEDIFAQKEKYHNLILLLENSEFKLKIEYETLRTLLADMQVRKARHSEDLIDII